jgi:hypothetical protein
MLQQLKGMLGAAGAAVAGPGPPPPAGSAAGWQQGISGSLEGSRPPPIIGQAAAVREEVSPEAEVERYLALQRRKQGLLPAALAVQSAWRGFQRSAAAGGCLPVVLPAACPCRPLCLFTWRY